MPHTTPNRKPPSVAALIREFSQARYITVNKGFGFEKAASNTWLAKDARDQMVQKYA